MFAMALTALSLGQPAAVPLWPGKAPFAVGDSEADAPTLTPYLTPDGRGRGAVVVCPGGGYGFLASDHEGKQPAEFFNSLGLHAFVLKYRIVAKDRPGPLGDAPLADVQRAVRHVRANADRYGVDAKKVGLMGFSAGGHLASTGGTHFAPHPSPADDVDKQSSRPDFLILAYPVVSMADGVTHGGSRKNLLGDQPDAERVKYFSNDEQVTAETPPTFIFHTDEDKAVLPENAVRFYLALKKAKVPAELHVYAKGKHGVGLGRDPKWTGGDTYAAGWPDRLAEWLAARGLVGK